MRNFNALLFLKNKQNLFLLMLLMAILVAYVFPFKETYARYFPLESVIDWGIAIIFLLYGLKLNIKEVVKDISNWKLHLLVQFGTFVLFPVLVLAFYPLFRGGNYFQSWLSVYFLACLPSTVSSSVVMVSIAKGNVTSAIFNASVSGLIGIVMTPLLMGFFMRSTQESGHSSEVIYQLLLKVLLPIILGLLLNPVFKNFINKYSKIIGEFDRLIILLIVYESFSKAFLQKLFTSVPPLVFFGIALAGISLFFVVYYSLKFLASKLRFNREDTITATFCGSKKSLVHGSLFVMVLGIPETQKVLFLLPILIYHSFQLFYVSWLAGKISMSAKD